MESTPTVATPKSRADRSPERPIVRRGLPATPGAGNLLVLKSGEELRENLLARLEAMKDAFETVKFYWEHILKDPDYNSTREYPEHSQHVAMWELRENVKDFAEYKSKMKRLKILADHFEPGKDYELTVDEAVEILS